jgi:hypothetical protein
MFRRGSFFIRLLAFLVLAAILIGTGNALFRAGFNQGYAQGAVIAADGEAGRAPYLPYSPYWGGGPYWGGPNFGFFPFFPIIGFLLFGFLIFGLFGALFRGGWGRHWGYPPGGHPKWRGPHPWHDEGESGPQHEEKTGTLV